MAKSNDHKIIEALASNAYMEVGRVNGIGSKAASERLLRAGLIERHPEWTGCFRLTKAGAAEAEQLAGWM